MCCNSWGRKESNTTERLNWTEGLCTHFRASLVAQTVKRLPAMWETWVRSQGWEDPLEKEMATHSRTIAWKIPWTEEPCRLQSMGLQRVGHDWATSLSLSRGFAPKGSFLAWSCQGPSLLWAPANPHHLRKTTNASRCFWLSLLWSHWYFPLSLGAWKVLFVPWWLKQ